MLLLLLASLAGAAEGVIPLELASKHSLQLFGRFDPSGLAVKDGRIFAVSDQERQAHIYELAPRAEDDALDVKIAHALPEEELAKVPRGGAKGPFRFEGLAWCQGSFFIADELSRSVIRVDGAGKVSSFRPRYAPYFGNRFPFQDPFAAGMEGLACDPTAGVLFLAHARQSRLVVAVDPDDAEVLADFDLPSPDLPRPLFRSDENTSKPAKRAAAAPPGQKGDALEPDFAGASFDQGHLYLLARAERLILKVDPRQRAVVARASYAKAVDGLYVNPPPQGLAGDIAVSGDKLYLVVDNEGLAQTGSELATSLLLVFKRPKGF